jgi:glycosyltransferase involved in cell wall biosynthesis
MMTVTPFLSVIVPACNGTGVLPRCFSALEASDLPRDEWELIVVDDASTDATGEMAARVADRVVRLEGSPHGPAYARNRGCEAARGTVVAFVDADVCVHPDTLSRMAATFRADDHLGAVFGAYDENPHEPGFLSQYRNLLHRYHHVTGAGDAETFWAGCGAVRASAFRSVGGYDELRYTKPQIEDIELGYRLRDAGHTIRLDPSIQGKHLKRWRFSNMLRTDIFDRGIPWVRLLLARNRKDRVESLNISNVEKLKTGAMGFGFLVLVAGLVLSDLTLTVAGAAAMAVVLATTWPLFSWFAKRRGLWFAVRIIPFQVLYYLINAVAVALGWIGHLLGRPGDSRPPRSVEPVSTS